MSRNTTETNQDTTYDVRPDSSDWYYCAIVSWKDSMETDYIDGCAVGKRPTMTSFCKSRECADEMHKWEAGMMVVSEEDCESVSKTRDVECVKCGKIYGKKFVLPFTVIEFTSEATPQGNYAGQPKKTYQHPSVKTPLEIRFV